MSLSVRTIEFHRTQIREKIGLQSQKDSLQAHLLSINCFLLQRLDILLLHLVNFMLSFSLTRNAPF